MKILIVEDSQDRIAWFETALEKHELTISLDAATGKAAVASTKFDVIFLDHDLGGEQMVDSRNENTGYQVAKTITTSKNSDTPVVIHSYNPVGAANMQSVLPHAVIRPYGTFDASIVEALYF
jgi:CheY-like chemotaxis protein